MGEDFGWRLKKEWGFECMVKGGSWMWWESSRIGD